MTGPRLINIALVVSIAFNLLFAGLIVTGAVRNGPFGPDWGRHPPRSHFSFTPHAFMRALPEDERDHARAMMEPHRDEIRQDFGKLRQARAEVAAAVTAQPFDRARLDAALADLRARYQAIAEASQGAIADVIESLDDKGRAETARYLFGHDREDHDDDHD